MTELSELVNKVHCMDALELMRILPDGSVDAIITDLPYGTTACSWDEIIPFEPMWAGVKRVLKPRGAFVTTASQPFTSKLIMSNLAWFKYEWVWEKTMATGFLNTPHMPLRAHENIAVFGGSVYNPQFATGTPYTATTGTQARDTIRDKSIAGVVTNNTGYRHPRTVLKFANETGLHPTQKPLDLYQYLIRTYTQPGDLVLDFCAGSGTTALAAATLNRRYITGDTSAEYCAIARKRLSAYTVDMFEVLP